MRVVGQASGHPSRADSTVEAATATAPKQWSGPPLHGEHGVLVTPLAQALSTSGTAAAPSNADPNGVLKYGFDLNNEFSNDFAPATEENDCSYTVTSNIYQSMTVPGNAAISGGVAQSWTISNNGSTVTFHIRPGLEFSNGQPVTAADVLQLQQHQDQPTTVVAVQHFEHRDAESHHRGRQPQQAHCG